MPILTRAYRCGENPHQSFLSSCTVETLFGKRDARVTVEGRPTFPTIHETALTSAIEAGIYTQYRSNADK